MLSRATVPNKLIILMAKNNEFYQHLNHTKMPKIAPGSPWIFNRLTQFRVLHLSRFYFLNVNECQFKYMHYFYFYPCLDQHVYFVGGASQLASPTSFIIMDL